MKPTRHKSKESGTQLVELGILLPILLLLCLGVIDLAALIHAHQVVSNAAREGARLSALPESNIATTGSTASIASRVRSYIADENDILCRTPVEVTVNQSVLEATGSGVSISASRVTVHCGYEMQYLPTLTAGLIPSSLTLEGKAEFRNFY